MTLKYITYLVFGSILCFFLLSCDDDNSTTIITTDYNDTQIYSFAIQGVHNKNQDSIPRSQDSIRFIQVNKTKFAIDQVGDRVTRMVYNPDSLPHGTVLGKLYVTATFNPIYGAGSVEVATPDSTYTWNTTDSIDFSKLPVTFKVTSYSGTATKTYKIDMRIHQVDPDTLIWKQMASYPEQIGNSKTVLYENKFYTYTVVSGVVKLFVADKNNLIWENKPLSGLPSNLKVSGLFVMNSTFYCIDNSGRSYKSIDGALWTQVINGESITSILGILPGADHSEDQLLVVYSNGSSKYLGRTENLSSITGSTSIPDYFPVTGNSSYTNFTADSRSRMLILTGGVDKSGADISYTWVVKEAAGELEVSPFIKNEFFKGTGISTFLLDNVLYTLSDNQFYTSETWGNIWTEASSKEALVSDIGKRTHQTAIVDDENYIWIFGGVSDNNEYYKDVWRGRINRLNP